MKNNKELENCYIIKVLLMLIIIVYHSLLIYGKSKWGPYEPAEPAPILGMLAAWLGTFHVYAFTFVSGYIFYALKHEYGRYHDFLAFINTKIKRLIVPYVFVSLIWCIPFHRVYFDAGIEEITVKYLLGMGPSQLWFLLMLFWCFLVFYILDDKIYKNQYVINLWGG